MKSFSATFFVLLYVLAMLRPVFPLFEYVVNQDYIAEFLCVNTDKPELACNGKCFLMEKITKQNEGKKQNIPRIAMEEYPIGFVLSVAIIPPKETFGTSTDIVDYRNSYHFIYSDSSFRPPTAVI